MKNTISEMKCAVEGIKSKLDETEIESVSWRTQYKKILRQSNKMKKDSKRTKSGWDFQPRWRHR